MIELRDLPGVSDMGDGVAPTRSLSSDEENVDRIFVGQLSWWKTKFSTPSIFYIKNTL